jgi:hypothetical protein
MSPPIGFVLALCALAPVRTWRAAALVGADVHVAALASAHLHVAALADAHLHLAALARAHLHVAALARAHLHVAALASAQRWVLIRPTDRGNGVFCASGARSVHRPDLGGPDARTQCARSRTQRRTCAPRARHRCCAPTQRRTCAPRAHHGCPAPPARANRSPVVQLLRRPLPPGADLAARRDAPGLPELSPLLVDELAEARVGGQLDGGAVGSMTGAGCLAAARRDPWAVSLPARRRAP